MWRDYIRLGIENIRRRRLRSWLTMIGIVIGIAAVVALISLGQGLTYTINEQFAKVGADKLIVQAKTAQLGPPGATPSTNKLYIEDYNVIKRSAGVELVSPRLLRQAKLEFNKKIKYGFVIGLEMDDSISILQEAGYMDISAGRPIRAGDRNKIMVGDGLVKESTFGRAIQINDKIKINGEEFTVVGITKPTGNPGTGSAIYMTMDKARELFNEPNEISVMMAKIKQGENPDVVAETITKDLRRSRDVKENKEDFSVESPRKAFESFLVILDVVQVLLVGLASISLLVGAVGIANTMFTAVLERTNEIGIMKAIGARNSDILRIFLIESALMGFVGGLLGILVGMGIGKLAELILAQLLGSGVFIVYFQWYLLLGTLLFAMIVGILAGIMPARQAASMNPVDALRH